MVYIAPLPQEKQRKRLPDVSTAGKAVDQCQQAKLRHPEPSRRKPSVQSSDTGQSEEELLANLTRQAEWHALVLQREKAALRAMQESKSGSCDVWTATPAPAAVVCPAPSSVSQVAGSAGNSSPTASTTVAGKTSNHRFFDAAAKVVDPSKVPGLGGLTAPAASTAAGTAAAKSAVPDPQTRLAQPVPFTASRPITRVPQGEPRAANSRRAPAKQQQQKIKQSAANRRQRQTLVIEEEQQPAATEYLDGPADMDDLQVVSPVAAASKARVLCAGTQTLPDSPQTAAGQVLGAAAGGACHIHQASRVDRLPSVGCYGAVESLSEAQTAAAPEPLEQAQQHHTLQEASWKLQQQLAKHQPQQQQQQQQQNLQDAAAEIADAVHAAQSHPDPAVRDRLLKEVRRKQYKLDLEQQIAERETARQAAKAAAAAKEAAEEARRAAAPPPWDPAVRAVRRGGGGEPLRGLDGAPVANLRVMKSQLALLQAEGSQPQLSSPQLQTPSSNRQAGTTGQPAATVAPLRPSNLAVDVGSGGAAGNRAKGFMGALNELKAGLSVEQQQAAAAARQQLQADLEAQIREKAARAAAQAAADAQRAAHEDESLRRFYNQQQQAAHDRADPQAAAWMSDTNQGHALSASSAVDVGGCTSYTAKPSPVRKGRCKHVIEAPWLDQNQQQQHVRQPAPKQQPAQQPEASGLQKDPSNWCIRSQAQLSATSGAASQQLGPEISVLNATYTTSDRINSQQLSAALQQLQEEQEVMRQEFSRQAQAVEQLLQDKQAAAAERNAALMELERVRHMLEQQDILQQRMSQSSLWPQQPLPNQQHSFVQRDEPAQQHSLPLVGVHGDTLDGFLVETQLVPVTVNNIPEGLAASDSFMQLVNSQPAMEDSSSSLRSSLRPPPARQHQGYNSCAPMAEASGHSTGLTTHATAQTAARQPGGNRDSWGAWPTAASLNTHKPPASPPILRSDRFVDKQPGQQADGGSSGKKAGGRSSRLPYGGGGSNRSPGRRRI